MHAFNSSSEQSVLHPRTPVADVMLAEWNDRTRQTRYFRPNEDVLTMHPKTHRDASPYSLVVRYGDIKEYNPDKARRDYFDNWVDFD